MSYFTVLPQVDIFNSNLRYDITTVMCSHLLSRLSSYFVHMYVLPTYVMFSFPALDSAVRVLLNFLCVSFLYLTLNHP